MNDWLNELKVGDEVAVFAGYSREPSVARVSRITKTLLIVGGHRIRKATGHSGGYGFGGATIREVTQEIRDAQERKSLRAKLVAVASDESTPLETLRAMLLAREVKS